MRRLLVLAAGLLALAGCSSAGGNPYTTSALPVSGRVLTPDGSPARGAEIVLTPLGKDGKAFGAEGSAKVAADGSFAIKTADGRDGVPGGYYAVVVRPAGSSADPNNRFAAGRVPRKYWSDETTDLKVEITDAKTNWEIRLAR